LGARSAFAAAAPSNRPSQDHKADITPISFKKPLHFGRVYPKKSENHPFVDGNKRVAVTVAAAFLKVNGYELNFDDIEAYSFLIGLYETGTLRFHELEVWLRRHAVKKARHASRRSGLVPRRETYV